MSSQSGRRTDGDYAYAGEQAESEDKIRKIHKMLIGRYRYAIVLALIGMVGGPLAGWRILTPEYQSVATLRIHQYTEDPQTEKTDVEKNIESYINSQRSIIEGSGLLGDAMGHDAWLTQNQHLSLADFADCLETEYSTKNKDREHFTIAFTHADKNVAFAALDAIVSTYKQQFHKRHNDKIAERLAELKTRREAKEREIAALGKQISQRTGGRGAESLKAEYMETDTELREMKRQLEAVNQQLIDVEKNNAGGDASQTMSDVLDERIAMFDDRMRILLEQRDQQISRIDALRITYGPQHNVMVRARHLLNTIEKDIGNRRREFDPSILPAGMAAMMATAADPQLLKQRKESLERKFQSLSFRLNDLNDLKSYVNDIELKLDTAQKSLQSIDQASERQSRDLGKIPLDIITGASEPTEPYNQSQRKQLAVLGGLLGGMLGFGAVLLIALRDRRFRDSDDARLTAGLGDLLGVLPTLPSDLADPEQAAIAAHCVHHIRTLLQVGDGENKRRVFSVTSPASGTGKTSLCLAMGLSFAESGERTLLIDCDLFGAQLSARVNAIVRRRIGQILSDKGAINEQQIAQALERSESTGMKLGQTLVEMGLATDPVIDEALHVQSKTRMGMLDVIRGQDLSTCITGAGFEKLWILPVGDAQPHDAGKLSPQAVGRMITEAARSFDIVVIDTGPVPASLEASVVAVASDGVILTVSRGEQRPQALKARHHLTSIGARVAGVVFNRASQADVDPYSYRPRSISGDRSLAEAMPRHAQGRKDPRLAGYDPVAKAVTLYAPQNSVTDSNGKAKAPRNGRTSGHIDEQKGGFVVDDD